MALNKSKKIMDRKKSKSEFLFSFLFLPLAMLILLVPASIPGADSVGQNKANNFEQVKSAYGSETFNRDELLVNKSTKTEGATTTFELVNAQKYENFGEVGDVEKYMVRGSDKSVILIPQNHKYPGSNAADSVNDSAELTQKQIYEMIDKLHDEYGIGLVMVEGELYGGVSGEKSKKIAENISLRDEFMKELESVEESGGGGNVSIFGELVEKGGDFIDKLNRQMYLQGAPYVLKAEGENIIIVGSENKDTREKSKKIVRKYIYLKDATRNSGELLSTGSDEQSKGDLSQSLSATDILSGGGQANSMGYIIDMAEKFSRLTGGEKLDKAVSALDKTYQKIKKLNTSNDTESSNTPSRSDNPYLDKSQGEIEKLMQENEKQMNKYVIEQRNIDAVENFKKATNEYDTNVGVLQFGAGHKDGLIEEFNERGVSVYVMTPKEVLRREDGRK